MKTAVITGAGSGIGQAIALRLAADHRIVVLDSSLEAAQATIERIHAQGGKGEAAACDVSQTEAVAAAFDRLDRVDVLVNNAGIAAVGNVEACAPDELDRVYQINVKGFYHCLHFAVPRMVAAGGGGWWRVVASS